MDGKNVIRTTLRDVLEVSLIDISNKLLGNSRRIRRRYEWEILPREFNFRVYEESCDHLKMEEKLSKGLFRYSITRMNSVK